MNISDPKLKLNIISLAPGSTEPTSSFKAYLEEHQVSYQIVDQQLQYAPLSFINDKVHMRTNQSISMRFNVFSEDLDEAQRNYSLLHKLVQHIKPVYTYERGQYIADVRNNTGIIAVRFAGLPKIHSTTDDLKIHLTSFAFSVNKEMGYIQTDYSGSNNESVSDKLVPIAYTLDIAGRILLEFNETARVSGGPRAEAAAASKRAEIPAEIIRLYEQTGRSVNDLTDGGRAQLLRLGQNLLHGILAANNLPERQRLDIINTANIQLLKLPRVDK